MALTQATLLLMARIGGSLVATKQADGTAAAVHPFIEEWRTAAELGEDTGAWGALWDEAMAAKGAALCLENPWNDDGEARGIILSEPVAGNPGNRTYSADADAWKSNRAGRRYVELQSRLGGPHPMLAI